MKWRFEGKKRKADNIEMPKEKLVLALADRQKQMQNQLSFDR